MMDFEAARVKMVDNQIRTTDVTSHSVLNAFLSVPREEFVPAGARALAYVDTDVEVAPGRFVMEPSPLAKLLQLAAITRNDVVLEIGCGSGYTAGLLSLLASSVVSLEVDETLAATATETLSRLGYDNVAVVTGPLEKGYAPEAPYDLIFVGGAVDHVPADILAQLREGGRLVAVIGHGNASRAKLFVKEGGAVAENSHFNTAVKPLPGFAKVAEFVF
jgi:protein-L-isoaspartate(D-aspartate) O-methyltransferase